MASAKRGKYAMRKTLKTVSELQRKGDQGSVDIKHSCTTTIPNVPQNDKMALNQVSLKLRQILDSQLL